VAGAQTTSRRAVPEQKPPRFVKTGCAFKHVAHDELNIPIFSMRTVGMFPTFVCTVFLATEASG
jgi:hypothetical protein